MSSIALAWAASSAKVADVEEYAILVRLADEADEFGCGAFLSTPSIARDTKVHPKTVQRRLDAMLERGLIGLGDQRKAQYIRADRRPVVYDLLIPYDAFIDIARTNQSRIDKSLAPLTRESRPVQADPPPPKRRSDVGKPKPKKDGATTSPPVDGGTTSPGGLPVPHGGTSSSSRGDYKSPDPGVDPGVDPGSLKPPPVAPLQGGAAADESTTTVQSEDVSPTPRDRAFGIGRGWIEYRSGKQLPIVARGRNGALHALRSLLEPFAGAGYSDDELKRALADIAEGIPSTAQLERALVARRSGSGGRNTGVHRARPSTTDQRVADTLAMGARLQAEADRMALGAATGRAIGA